MLPTMKASFGHLLPPLRELLGSATKPYVTALPDHFSPHMNNLPSRSFLLYLHEDQFE